MSGTVTAHICVVTGGNKGIGYATVKALCESAGSNSVVYLTARSVDRGSQAVQQLHKQGLKPVFHQLDVEDASSIATFASYIKSEHGGLDVLVNNAGFAFSLTATEPFAEQAEITNNINYFGLQAVCHALFPLLRAHARVVNVSSCAGHLSYVPGAELRSTLASPDLTEQQLDQLITDFVRAAGDGSHTSIGWPDSAYSVSKVGVSALTRIQQKQMDTDANREDIIINSCHPGYVETDMTADMPYEGRITTEQGAVSPTYLALLPRNCGAPRGQYLWHDKRVVDWVTGTLPPPGY